MIDKDLTSIRGISAATVARLAQQGIYTVSDLQQKTRLPEDRAFLSLKISINLKTLYVWAKQADLMRIDDINGVISELLVTSGIRNVVDLADADTQILKQLVDISFNNSNIGYTNRISVTDLEVWKKKAAELGRELENDPDDKPLAILFSNLPSVNRKLTLEDLTLDLKDKVLIEAKENVILAEANNSKEFLNNSIQFERLEKPAVREGGFYFGLAEMIAEIGRGVAKAQHELDKSSIAIQNYIDSQETLSNYGLSATWYVLPETSFQMKVDYAVVKEESEEGEKPGADNTSQNLINSLRVAPVNAKYQNYFKSSANVESELNFKIVPVPPPVRFTEHITVPDLIGLSVDEAQERIKASRLRVGVLKLIEDVEPDNDKDTQVIAQSKEAGTGVLVNDVISLAFARRDNNV